MFERPCPHTLELNVTGEEWRAYVFAARLQGQSPSDYLREALGMPAERDVPLVQARVERQRSSGRLRLASQHHHR
jgi:hypothetical protein